jgi:hypothetical protein
MKNKTDGQMPVVFLSSQTQIRRIYLLVVKQLSPRADGNLQAILSRV